MTLSDEQKATLDGISPMGLHFNKGLPCECGSEAYSTAKERGYSDSMMYTHTCRECGNVFETWTEG